MRVAGNKTSLLFLFLILLTSVRAAGAAEILYKEPLQQLQMVTSPLPVAPGSHSESIRALRFDAFGKNFDINLQVNRTLLNAAQRARLDERYEIYRGNIAGLPGSWVRLVIADGVPRGMLWDGSELMAIEATGERGKGAEKAFIYRLSDLTVPPGMLACSDLGNPENAV